MTTNIFPRLLGVLGIFAALTAVFWAIVHFGLAQQSGLASDLVERLDGDPARIQSYLDEMSATLTTAGAGSLLAAAVLTCLWLFMIHRNPPYGDQSARAKRGSWAALLLAALVVAGGLFWIQVIGAPIAELLAPNVPLTVTAVGIVLLVVGYWLATGLFAPASTKVAVPGGRVFGG